MVKISFDLARSPLESSTFSEVVDIIDTQTRNIYSSFKLEAEIFIPKIEFEPCLLNFGDLRIGVESKLTVNVINKSDFPVDVDLVFNLPESIENDLILSSTSLSLKSLGSVQVEFKLKPSSHVFDLTFPISLFLTGQSNSNQSISTLPLSFSSFSTQLSLLCDDIFLFVGQYPINDLSVYFVLNPSDLAEKSHEKHILLINSGLDVGFKLPKCNSFSLSTPSPSSIIKNSRVSWTVSLDSSMLANASIGSFVEEVCAVEFKIGNVVSTVNLFLRAHVVSI
ncbi:hypothetical protein RCL1_003967 [Eukaryota sp. TZLM3-RCL]